MRINIQSFAQYKYSLLSLEPLLDRCTPSALVFQLDFGLDQGQFPPLDPRATGNIGLTLESFLYYHLPSLDIISPCLFSMRVVLLTTEAYIMSPLLPPETTVKVCLKTCIRRTSFPPIFWSNPVNYLRNLSRRSKWTSFMVDNSSINVRAAFLMVFASFEFILILKQESLKHGIGTPNLLWNMVPRTSRVDEIPDIAVSMTILCCILTYDRDWQ